MLICCISDLHGSFPTLREADLLIIAGDLTTRDSPNCWNEFLQWLRNTKFRKRVIIGGNHDARAQRGLIDLRSNANFDYLQDSGIEFEGQKIWGAPWTRKFRGQNPTAMAFALDTEIQMKERWELIPADTDILVTHAPPFGILDSIPYETRVGCVQLANQYTSKRIAPWLHVFGHIHSGYGIRINPSSIPSETMFINAAYMNEDYHPINKPIYVEVEDVECESSGGQVPGPVSSPSL